MATNGTSMTPAQLLQLRSQIYAFRLLSRNLAVPEAALPALSGSLPQEKVSQLVNGAAKFDALPAAQAKSLLGSGYHQAVPPGFGSQVAAPASSAGTVATPKGVTGSSVRMQFRRKELQQVPNHLPKGVQVRAKIEMHSLGLLELQKKVRKKVFQAKTSIENGMDFSRHVAQPPSLERFLGGASQIHPSLLLDDPSSLGSRSKLLAQQRAAHREYLKSVLSYAKNLKEFHRQKKAREQKCILKRIQVYHTDKVKLKAVLEERQERERIRMLKDNDLEGYMQMLDETKNKRLMTLLEQTDKYLEEIGDKIGKHKQANDLDGGVFSPRAKKKRALEAESSKTEDASEAMPAAEEPPAQEELGEEGEIMEKEEGEVTETEEDQIPADQQRSLAEMKKRQDTYYQLAHGVDEKIVTQPKCLLGGSLKEYQLQGLNWLVSLYNNNLNGILADEMGLGKTIQTIALLTYLQESKGNPGPFLIIVPLSTVDNWKNELSKWAPDFTTIIYKGGPQERKRLFQEDMQPGRFNVVVTTYEYVMKDKSSLHKIVWDHLIIDEGHRIKNANCKLVQILGNHYQARRRILLTGTPLQNSIPELWALLNFLLPTIFSSVDTFEQWFSTPFEKTGESVGLNEEETILVINRLHQVLRPFLLRRLKAEVMSQLPDKVEKVIKCELSGWQRRMYNRIKKDGRARMSGAGASKTLNNTVMQLRKVTNHPYLFVDEYPLHDDGIVRAAGKFHLLDRILPKLFVTNHRVLIFCQMTECMNVLEDYFGLRNFKFLRLDGSTKSDDRGEHMRTFLQDDSYFIFLLSTRAGGLGLNLQTADTVIIFDSDWNPQMDLQAQDRAHRIGQKREVRVLRFLTNSGVEEQILAKATEKLRLDRKVIQAGKFNNKSSHEDRKEALKVILEEEAAEDGEDNCASADEIIRLIARGEEETKLFHEMDQGTAELPEGMEHMQWTPPTMFTEEEGPEWWQEEEEEEEEDISALADDYGRGARAVRSTIDYSGLSDREFDRMLQSGVSEDVIKQEKEAKASKRKRSESEQPSPTAEGWGSSRGAAAAGDEEDYRDEEAAQQAPSDAVASAPPLATSIRKIKQAILSLKAIGGRKVCELFLKLPTREEMPEYYSVVSEPIDFEDINEKLKSNTYGTMEDFEQDLALLCNNAQLFNHPDSQVYHDATTIRNKYKKELKILRTGSTGANKDRALPPKKKAKVATKAARGRASPSPQVNREDAGPSPAVTARGEAARRMVDEQGLVQVVCNGHLGVLDLHLMQVRDAKGTIIKPTQFEKQCGMGSFKKWKNSVHIRETDQPVDQLLKDLESIGAEYNRPEGVEVKWPDVTVLDPSSASQITKAESDDEDEYMEEDV